MSDSNLTPEQIKKLRLQLSPGDITEIAKRSGIKRDAFYNLFRKGRAKFTVIEALLDFIELKHKQKQRIDKL